MKSILFGIAFWSIKIIGQKKKEGDHKINKKKNKIEC